MLCVKCKPKKPTEAEKPFKWALDVIDFLVLDEDPNTTSMTIPLDNEMFCGWVDEVQYQLATRTTDAQSTVANLGKKVEALDRLVWDDDTKQIFIAYCQSEQPCRSFTLTDDGKLKVEWKAQSSFTFTPEYLNVGIKAVEGMVDNSDDGDAYLCLVNLRPVYEFANMEFDTTNEKLFAYSRNLVETLKRLHPDWIMTTGKIDAFYALYCALCGSTDVHIDIEG